jgi:murein DD-endopeptidase MepM/ murein hydrolase activator NlpD
VRVEAIALAVVLVLAGAAVLAFWGFRTSAPGINANIAAVASPNANLAPPKQPEDTQTASNATTNRAPDPALPSRVRYPLKGFTERITKKRFGQYITKTNSPVQPERFSGYHTGADAETEEAEKDTDIPVFAVADGKIVARRTAAGYGCVVLIEHTVDGETVTAVYGHVRLASVLKRAGSTVERGERIGVLGTGFTSETDGERKHLHFGILRGSSTSLLGYVQSEAALTAWLDPIPWLQARNAAEPQ